MSDTAQQADITPEVAEKIRRQNIRNIIARVKAGKPLATHEQKALDLYFREKTNAAAGINTTAKTAKSYFELSKIFGTGPKSFIRWRKVHGDTPRPNAGGDHDVDAWRKWFSAHPEVRPGGGSQEPEQIELREVKLLEQIRGIRFENDVNEGKFMAVAEARGIVREMYEHHRQMLVSSFADELPPIIEGMAAPAIRVEMLKAINRILQAYRNHARHLAQTGV